MKVKFVPQNVEVEIKPGQSVMHLAEDNGIYVKSVCRGVPSCAECRVRVVEGQGNALSPTRDELNLIGSGWFLDQRRLSCQLQCIGNITVDMSEQIAKSQGLVLGQKKRKALQNDRVEDEVVIRDPSASRSGDTEGEGAGEADAPRAPARSASGHRDRDRGGPRSPADRQPRADRGPQREARGTQGVGPNASASSVQTSNSTPPNSSAGPSRRDGRPEGGGGRRRRRGGGRGGGGGPQGGGGGGPQGGNAP